MDTVSLKPRKAGLLIGILVFLGVGECPSAPVLGSFQSSPLIYALSRPYIFTASDSSLAARLQWLFYDLEAFIKAIADRKTADRQITAIMKSQLGNHLLLQQSDLSVSVTLHLRATIINPCSQVFIISSC
jgi:hypothetical protein